MIEAREFGASLRRERERRGITLDEIAEQTKVSASVLGGLERGDLSRWPSGIFRRAFVRSYAAAVGLDVEGTLAEFIRVFPEDGGAVRPRPIAGGPPHVMRLALGEHGTRTLDWRRAAGAAIDAGLPMAIAAGGWFLASAQGACLAALAVAIAWHASGAIAWGTSPGLRLMRRRPALVPRPEAAPPPAEVQQPEAEQEIARAPLLLPPSPGRTRLARRDRRPGSRPERGHGADARLR